MTTNNYLEYFLTLLGWVVNNGLWNVLISTGLFALPLAFRIIGIWLKVREEGADEGNKGCFPCRVLSMFSMVLFCDDILLCSSGTGDAGYAVIR